MKYFKILLFIKIVLISSIAYSHECVLKDDSTFEINLYNLCLSDEIGNIDNNKDILLKEEIKRLKIENDLIKNKLYKIKLSLQNLLLNL